MLRTLLTSAVILGGGITALDYVTLSFRSFTTETARRLAVAEQSVPVPPLALEGAEGRPLSLETWRGRWLVVDFIYTSCTEECSLQGMIFARMARHLAAQIAAGQVQLLSLSFDPARDDPVALRRYLHSHGAHGTGWTAARPIDATSLASLRERFGLMVIPDARGGFEHNAAIVVIDPRGYIVTMRDWDDDRGTIAFLLSRLAG